MWSSQAKVSRLAGEVDDAGVGRQEREQGIEGGRLADLARLGGAIDRDARLDQQPERGGQFGVEGALADQRDDRAFGGVVGHGPSLRRGPKTGQTADDDVGTA